MNRAPGSQSNFVLVPSGKVWWTTQVYLSKNQFYLMVVVLIRVLVSCYCMSMIYVLSSCLGIKLPWYISQLHACLTKYTCIALHSELKFIFIGLYSFLQWRRSLERPVRSIYLFGKYTSFCGSSHGHSQISSRLMVSSSVRPTG